MQPPNPDLPERLESEAAAQGYTCVSAPAFGVIHGSRGARVYLGHRPLRYDPVAPTATRYSIAPEYFKLLGSRR